MVHLLHAGLFICEADGHALAVTSLRLAEKDIMKRSGKIVMTADVAAEHGFKDVDGGSMYLRYYDVTSWQTPDFEALVDLVRIMSIGVCYARGRPP